MINYIHIPKTAGSSIIGALSVKKNVRTIGHGVNFGVIDLDQIKFKDAKSNDFTFTVVRNPYDRFISAYNYLKFGGIKTELDLRYSEILNSMSLDEFIDRLPEFINIIIHFVPQYLFVDTNTQIFRYETLSSDLRKIGVTKIPKSNITKNKEISKLNEEQKQKIAKIYEKDFEIFCYFP